jgi:alanine racemase
MAVVKANAYGHGASIVAPLLRSDVDWFGVDSLEEAEELSSLGVSEPILVMGHTDPADADRVVAGGFRQVLFRRDVAEALAKAARKQKTPALVHLKIETGLNRLGVEPRDAAALVAGLDGLAIEGIYTHFADVEDPESELYRRQIERLREAAARLKALCFCMRCRPRGRSFIPRTRSRSPASGSGSTESGRPLRPVARRKASARSPRL